MASDNICDIYEDCDDGSDERDCPEDCKFIY